MAGTDPTEPVLIKTKKKHQECSNREDSVRRGRLQGQKRGLRRAAF